MILFCRLQCEGTKGSHFAEKNIPLRLKRVVDHENHFAYICTPLFVSTTYRSVYKSGKPSIFALDDYVSSLYLGFAMHIALKDIITLKASQYVESGLWKKRMDNTMKDHYWKVTDKIEPQVLRVKHLSLGFIIICVMWAVSTVAFVFEFAPKFYRKLKKQFKLLKKQLEMCLMVYVVVKFMQMKKLL
jgi:hypothetical protein